MWRQELQGAKRMCGLTDGCRAAGQQSGSKKKVKGDGRAAQRKPHPFSGRELIARHQTASALWRRLVSAQTNPHLRYLRSVATRTPTGTHVHHTCLRTLRTFASCPPLYSAVACARNINSNLHTYELTSLRTQTPRTVVHDRRKWRRQVHHGPLPRGIVD